MKSELLAAIEQGDAARVRDLIVGASEKERRAAAPAVSNRSNWPFTRDAEPWRASALARIGTGTARQVSSEWWSLYPLRVDDRDDVVLALVADVIAARGRTLRLDPRPRDHRRQLRVRQLAARRHLVRGGVVERPEGDGYTRAMVTGLGGMDGHRRLESVYEALRADPELLDEELWRIFDTEVGAELANAQAWEYKRAKDPRRATKAREPLDVRNRAHRGG